MILRFEKPIAIARFCGVSFLIIKSNKPGIDTTEFDKIYICGNPRKLERYIKKIVVFLAIMKIIFDYSFDDIEKCARKAKKLMRNWRNLINQVRIIYL